MHTDRRVSHKGVAALLVYLLTTIYIITRRIGYYMLAVAHFPFFLFRFDAFSSVPLWGHGSVTFSVCSISCIDIFSVAFMLLVLHPQSASMHRFGTILSFLCLL